MILRLAYGLFMVDGFLWLWDSNKLWAELNIHKIFSKDKYGDAAWFSYVSFNQVFDNIYTAIEPIMLDHLPQLKTYQKSDQSRGDGSVHQAVHHGVLLARTYETRERYFNT